MNKASQSVNRAFFVHETSCVDENVLIGKGTKIWHFSHILKGVRIGKNCIVGQNVMIGPDVEIGNGCKIQNNVSIYKGVTLEDAVFCGPSCVFTNVINPGAFIERKDEYKKTLVKQGATIGANTTIICGITIGRYAFVGAGSVVTKDVPDYGLVYGNPAGLKGWICECAMKIEPRNTIALCKSCKEEYELVDGKIIKKYLSL